MVEHFDSVTSEIDYFFETQLQAIAGDETKAAELNTKREVLLEEIKKAQLANLTNLNAELVNTLNLSPTEDVSALFGVFCFVFKFEKHISLIVTDAYLTSAQLDVLRGLSDFACIEGDKLCFKLDKEICTSQNPFFEAVLNYKVMKKNSFIQLF